ncbi:MAG: tyrosine recombinase XerC [Rhodocyclaceae bacterium]
MNRRGSDSGGDRAKVSRTLLPPARLPREASSSAAVVAIEAPAIVLPALAVDYLRYLETERRAARLTLEAYRGDLLRLAGLAEGRVLQQLTTHDVRRFVARMHAGGLGGRSIARVLSTWRGFYRWLVRRHGLPLNPVDPVRAPRAAKRLPRALSPDQSKALMEVGDDGALAVRDRAMFELFYSSGLRLAELAGLEVGAGLDLEAGMVTVLGKRGKMRMVPVGEPALVALRAWLTERARWAAPEQALLFVTRSGGALSGGAIRSRLKRWTSQSELGLHVHPHMLRHSFASQLLQSSGDLRGVQELLGHASIRSTQVYTHLDFQHLARVYDDAHPRARKR